MSVDTTPAAVQTVRGGARSSHIGMVAGEPSGDMLAARIMQGLAEHKPGVICQGIGGPRMQAQGFESWHPMHALTVFGYVDALKRIPSLLSIYGDTKRRLLAERPSVFVGIDAPDFNLKLELQLRRAGVPTVHFVGPSIWAWRYERIHKIREAVSHMLVLFPFEEEIYRKEGIPVTYVGHPLAGAIPMKPDRAAARARLGLEQGVRILAMMPGSRSSEIKVLAPRFLQALQKLQKLDPALQCVVPMVNAQRRAEFDEFLRQYPVANLRIITADDVVRSGPTAAGRAEGNGQSDGQGAPAPVAWSVMEAADAVLVASGTATLEAALFKRPMVISYYLPTWMRRIMSWKSKQQRPYLPWVGLPNVLLRDFAVPELLQDDATPEKLAEATWIALTDDANAARVEARFTAMHQELLRDTPALAAQAIIEVSSRGSV